MSSHFAKPENALRKGKDLVKVGKPGSALKTLHNILVARRYRLWSPTHEKIMVRSQKQQTPQQQPRANQPPTIPSYPAYMMSLGRQTNQW
jgi:hypothetical protein